jgi:hypothetical protein
MIAKAVVLPSMHGNVSGQTSFAQIIVLQKRFQLRVE